MIQVRVQIAVLLVELPPPAGPDVGLVFEAANVASLDEVRVPGLFTYNGFYAGLLDHMTTIAGALAKRLRHPLRHDEAALRS